MWAYNKEYKSVQIARGWPTYVPLKPERWKTQFSYEKLTGKRRPTNAHVSNQLHDSKHLYFALGV
jgi:hypothetical protein